ARGGRPCVAGDSARADDDTPAGALRCVEGRRRGRMTSVRIAMWSGPRNISTAMMRSFENRPDCAVVDEPFYAAYLAATGLDHPMRDAVLASQRQDWRAVVAGLDGLDSPVVYEKHMTHHQLPGFRLES